MIFIFKVFLAYLVTLILVFTGGWALKKEISKAVDRQKFEKRLERFANRKDEKVEKDRKLFGLLLKGISPYIQEIQDFPKK